MCAPEKSGAPQRFFLPRARPIDIGRASVRPVVSLSSESKISVAAVPLQFCLMFVLCAKYFVRDYSFYQELN